ncbi:response regulator transcription factor [Ktedonosporobacter rubrisoli]|uniref:Response regulator transcription factor n=1 Tax=Ktedonosporobacter rubrisoli TaxID=2509675 RepID=A0A4P6JY72_KTERU|nr:response regulator transcription factor [Ktedonosporobacter rubrisoli]QBD80380.1 response regulator transcription factor [Ktedonosporobacter rubrisoli]
MLDKRQPEPGIRVVIADDHFIVREGLHLILDGESDFVVVGEAKDGAQAVQLVEELQPDVVLMDLRMPGMDGLEAIELIHHRWPQVALVILTTYSGDELMLRGLRAGAAGYLLKDVSRATLYQTVRAAAAQATLIPTEIMQRLLNLSAQPQIQSCEAEQRKPAQLQKQAITGREREVLRDVARGCRNKEIARRLGISEPTVKSHLASIYYKLGVDSRASAVAVALQRGWLNPG